MPLFNSPQRLTRSISRRLAILWTLLILAACSLPGSTLPDMETGFPLDKVAHFTFFFGYALLWMHASARTILQRAALVVGTGVLYGILIEIYQGRLPLNRSPDIWDAVADFAGLLAGLLVYFLIKKMSSRT